MACKDVQDQDNTALASASLLWELADQLVEWKNLGRNLGLTDQTLHYIELDYYRNSKEIKYRLLLHWRQTSGQQATIGNLAKALKKANLADLADYVMQVETVKNLLSKELTVEDCYESATFLGLPARDVQEIKQSPNSAVALIDKIDDGKDNSDSTFNALLFALKPHGNIRVANLILNSGLPSSIKARASSKEDILPACVCGHNSYKELKSQSDESIVSLQCNKCAAEWFPTTESAKEASLVWDNKKFSYKIPLQLDLSKLKHEQVKEVNDLQHGDHIFFRRLWGIYHHHAIFLHMSEKDKIKVIHWTSQEKGVADSLWRRKENPIHISCDDIMFPTGCVRRVQYPNCDPAKVVVARAYDMLHDSSQKYDLVKNNCESLATFCKIGKAYSIQGEKLGEVLPFVPNFVTHLKQ